MKPVSILTLILCALLTACSPSSSPRKTPALEAAEKRLQTAEAMFQERCKSAGEKIHRTVDNVEGIFLMKIRPKETNFGDQFSLTDPYGDDVGSEGYLISFLRGRTADGSLTDTGGVTKGYAYVEAIDPHDGKRYRYTGRIDQPWLRDKSYGEWVREFVLDKTLAPGPQPRYGVTYDDISTREEREYWIAGSSLKVIDLRTNEVIAERIGYMMDRGQGDRGAGNGRSPWLIAAGHACPAFPTRPGGLHFTMRQTRNFVEKVLHIKQGK